MEKYQYTTSMGIQPTACVRKVHIRYSFPKEQPSTGGKDDGARRLWSNPSRGDPSKGNPIRAKRIHENESEQDTRPKRANNLVITVHCSTASFRQLRPVQQVEPPATEDESEQEQRVLSLPSLSSRNRKRGALYLRLVGSAYPLKESYNAKSLFA